MRYLDKSLQPWLCFVLYADKIDKAELMTCIFPYRSDVEAYYLLVYLSLEKHKFQAYSR